MKKVYTIICLCLLTSLISTNAFTQFASIDAVATSSDSENTTERYQSTSSSKREFSAFILRKINATSHQKKSISPLLESIGSNESEEINWAEVYKVQKALTKQQADVFLLNLQLQKQNLISYASDNNSEIVVRR